MIGHINNIAEKSINQKLKELEIYDDVYNSNQITEIIINSNQCIFTKNLGIGFIEKNNKSEDDKVINLLKILASLDNKQLTDINPNISTKLLLSNKQKIRIEGLIPPTVEHPTLNIRKQSLYVKTLEDYLEDKYLNHETYNLLIELVLNHKNILIIGGTDTGKTTFLNALLKKIEEKNQRTIIIEDTPELQMNSTNVVKVQTIPKIFTPDMALKYCMRASPERIIFGEIRDGKAGYELISGFNSGHPGGISTIHADDGLGGLKKLEMYINSVYGKPMSDDIGMAIDVLITVKMQNYKRYLESIDICEGYNRNNNQYILRNIYSYNREENFLKKEKNILLKYAREKLRLDEIILKILERKKLEEIENFILTYRK